MASFASSKMNATTQTGSRKSAFGRYNFKRNVASVVPRVAPEEKVAQLLSNNRTWAKQQVKYDAGFFERLKNQQSPEYLWIGCADSRVPANTIIGLDPGEVFVQRNVGNQASHRDMNCQSCIEFSVNALGVKSIIVCGHYKCGAVKAALTLPSKTPGLVNCWISDIREARNQNLALLKGLPEEEQVRKLVELNVLRQVFHVCTSPTVQNAWAEGKELSVHGMCYDVADGMLKNLVGPITSNEQMKSGGVNEFSSDAAASAPPESSLFGLFKSEPAPKAPPKPKSDVEVYNEILTGQLSAHASWDEGAKK